MISSISLSCNLCLQAAVKENIASSLETIDCTASQLLLQFGWKYIKSELFFLALCQTLLDCEHLERWSAVIRLMFWKVVSFRDSDKHLWTLWYVCCKDLKSVKLYSGTYRGKSMWYLRYPSPCAHGGRGAVFKTSCRPLNGLFPVETSPFYGGLLLAQWAKVNVTECFENAWYGMIHSYGMEIRDRKQCHQQERENYTQRS